MSNHRTSLPTPRNKTYQETPLLKNSKNVKLSSTIPKYALGNYHNHGPTTQFNNALPKPTPYNYPNCVPFSPSCDVNITIVCKSSIPQHLKNSNKPTYHLSSQEYITSPPLQSILTYYGPLTLRRDSNYFTSAITSPQG